MRPSRILLLFVITLAATAAFAGAYASTAGALAFTDGPCYPDASDIKVCPQGETGNAYSVQLQGRAGTGCVPFVKFSILPGSALPAGLSLSTSGLISGTPTATGTTFFWVNMQDILGAGGWCADSNSTQREFSITILQGLLIKQTAAYLQPAQVNAPYSFQLTADGGGTQTWSVTSGSLPAGLTLSSSGLISGTPTQTGDIGPFKITVSDGSRSNSQTYHIAVVNPLKVTTAGARGELGQALTVKPGATGGTGPYTWAATGLPDGLTLDPTTGIITGVPTATGLATVQLSVTDKTNGGPLTVTANLELSVAARLAFAGTPLRHGKVGVSYHGRIAVVGGVAPRRFRIIRGTLPAGLRLNVRSGALTGTPHSAGTFRVTVRVTDQLGVLVTHTFVLKVS
jgi:hypothetical protein